jgi:very-short-patch-repair endonuclease
MHQRESPRQRESAPARSLGVHVDGVRRGQCAHGAGGGERFHVDGLSGAIASRQHGIVTRAQLLDAGVGAGAIDHWVSTGRLLIRHRGVYALGHGASPRFADVHAAVLAYGPCAIASHRTAASMWGFVPAAVGGSAAFEAREGTIDVTVVGRHARPRPGIRLHRTDQLMRADLSHLEGIPLSSPARALLELAAVIESERELELALHEAIALRLATIEEVQTVLARYPQRPGCALLATLADPRRRLSATDSGGAERLHRLIRRSGLPDPKSGARVGRWPLDFFWPEAALGAEVDGYDFHSTLPRVERDHRKDHDVRELGVLLLRFTGRQVRREPEYVLVTLARQYERRVGSRS